MRDFCSLKYLVILGLTLGTGIALGSDSGEDDSQNDSAQMMYVGYPLRITCNFTRSEEHEEANANAEGHPVIELEWFKDDELLVAGDRVKIYTDNFTMIINKAEKTDIGKYRCQTKAFAGEDPVSKTIQVIFLEIRKMDKSVNVVEKEDVSIECPADGTPIPVITWLKDQKPIAELMVNNSRITLSPNGKDMPNGTLTIRDAQYGDRGNYTCVVTSIIQSYEKWTFLRVRDVYAALWPFIGIVIEVIVLGIIIIIFEKRAKAEFDESDTDQGNDQ